ncbi:MAG: cytochrome c5 family protein [Gammaproteobacteria bacterium]|nr:MAG: cytochrome c5 family protein [Gammaproteobacteria bacterium]
MNFRSKTLLVTLSMVCGLALAHHLDPENIDKRTAPVGKVYKVGDKVPDVTASTGSNEKAARSGETIVNTFCAGCHASGAAGAPKIGNKADWAPRVAKGKDTLVKHALQGFNAMPPKGLCMDCSDDEIKAAVSYLLKQVQ